MRIGHFVSLAAAKKGFARVVSGHIQTPLHSLGLLQEAGHEVHLITNRHGDERTTPFCMPSTVPIHYVGDSRRRADVLRFPGKAPGGTNPLMLARQVKEIRDIVRSNKLDVLHFFGHTRTAQLAGGIATSRPGVPIVASICSAGAPRSLRGTTRWLLQRVDSLTVPTGTSQESFLRMGIQTKVVQHGIVRDLRDELDQEPTAAPFRVLFWRNPHRDNGADVCVAAFDQLAPLFPEISFDLALRPDFEEIDGIDDLAAKHSNVRVHRYPYEAGTTLAGLVAESICAVMPFRKLSLDPQMAILETLAAGVPVVATDLHSVSEFVQPGQTGELVPVGDIPATIAAIHELLENRERAEQMGQQASALMSTEWNWNAWVGDVTNMYQSVGVSDS